MQQLQPEWRKDGCLSHVRSLVTSLLGVVCTELGGGPGEGRGLLRVTRDQALRGLAVWGLGKAGSSWEGVWLHREVLRKSLED